MKEKEKRTSAGRPCCVGFIYVLVYLVGGVVAAVSAVGLRPLLWQHLRCSHCCCPDGGGVQRFCQSAKRHVSESVGCGFGSGPRTRKASMCQDYCEISR